MTSSDLLITRVLAWSKERFPPVTLVSAFLLFALAMSVVHFQLHQSVKWSINYIWLGLALTCQFLLLRVLDEHKDYQQDLITHPNRVLQKGLITLNNLKVVGALGTLLGLIITYTLGDSLALYSWLAMMAWTGLMTKEFFIPKLLKKSLLVYSVSHMLVLPFMVLWVALLSDSLGLNASILPYVLVLTFINGLIYELQRKTKGSDEDIKEEDTYTHRWGIPKTVNFTALLGLLSFSTYAYICKDLFHFPLSYHIPTALGLILLILAGARHSKEKTAKTREGAEGAGALFVLIEYLTIIIILTHL